mgnify:FL=1
MEKPEALEKIINMMIDVCAIDEANKETITLETKTSDVIDSLDALELSMAIEKETDGKITDYAIANWNTIGDIVATYINLKDE